MLPNDNVSMSAGHLDHVKTWSRRDPNVEMLSLGNIFQLCRVRSFYIITGKMLVFPISQGSASTGRDIPINVVQHSTKCTWYFGTNTLLLCHLTLMLTNFQFFSRTVTDWNAFPDAIRSKLSLSMLSRKPSKNFQILLLTAAEPCVNKYVSK